MSYAVFCHSSMAFPFLVVACILMLLLPRRQVYLLSPFHHLIEPMPLLVSFWLRYPITPLVLGQPWLRLDNPYLDRTAGTVVSWSSNRLSTCLGFQRAPAPLPLEPADLSGVPAVYHNLREVFSKQRALSLPPHGPMTVPQPTTLKVLQLFCVPPTSTGI